MARRLVRRGALAAACATWAYLRLVRPWHQRWGATADEVRRPLPGDQEIPKPTVQSTRAITIAGPPAEVWPWIAQIGYVGYGRAGWYAFDFWDADAGRGRSSWRLLPEAQRLQVGLRIGEEGFTVRSFQACSHLVLAYHYPQVDWVLKEGLWPKFGECSFAFVLQPTNDQGTRLLVRTRFTSVGSASTCCGGRSSRSGTSSSSGGCCRASNDALRLWLAAGARIRSELPAKDDDPERPDPKRAATSAPAEHAWWTRQQPTADD